MISRFSRVLGCSTLFAGLIVSAQQPPVPLNDTPPTLSLPPLPALPKPEDKKIPSAPGSDAGNQKPEVKPVAPVAALPKKSAPTLPTNSASSTTGDGQFVIHGADLATRTWFSTQCETVAADLRKLLRDPAPWSLPVVISVRTAPNISLTDAAVAMSVRPLTSGGFHLQLTVQMRPDFNSNDLRTELIRVLLAERILRDQHELTTTRRPVLPVWLLTGVTEALRYRERSRPSATFAAVFKTGRVFGIEEILGAAPTSLDALSRTIYETSSCALVLALLEQPEGNLRMAKFLSALATDARSDRDVMNQWFPGIAQSKTSLDKWWSLQMAHLSRPTVWETLDPQETAKALELALAFHYESEVEVNAPARSKAPDNDGDETPKAEEEEHRSFFGKLFGGSSKDKEEAGKPKPEKPKPEKKPEPEVDEKPQQTGVLTRLFGGGDEKGKDAKKEDKKPEKKTAPKPEKKPEPKPEPKKEEPKRKADMSETPPKTGVLRRWFSGNDKEKAKAEPTPKDTKKPEPEKKNEAESKKEDAKKSASLAMPMLLRVVADLTLPQASMLFDAQELVTTPAARSVILGFGKKKDDPEEQAKAEAKKEKEAEDKKKKEDARKAEAAKREEEAKLAAARKAEAKKEKDAKKEEGKKPAPGKAEPKKEEPKKEPPPAPKPSAKKRKVVVNAPVEDYAKILKRADGKSILAATATDLSVLQQRAHPLFKAIISDYITLIAQIASSGVKDADAQLKKLRERTAGALKQARAVQDHVDWFEASENTKWSGTFDDYLRLKETIQQEMPKRTDAISRLLDEVEKQPVAQ